MSECFLIPIGVQAELLEKVNQEPRFQEGVNCRWRREKMGKF